MLQRGLRGLIATALALGGVASCGAPAGPDDEATIARKYLSDSGFRRSVLVGSLAYPSTGYARLRLARYESAAPDDWSRLPLWNPPAAPLLARDLGAPTTTQMAPLAITSAAQAGDLDALRSLGAAAFRVYPAQLASPTLLDGVHTPADAARYGLWTHPDDDQLGGLVRLRLPDGSAAVAFSCSTCHATPDALGRIVWGLTNASLDLGALSAATAPTIPEAVRARLLAWGPGRVDVTTDDASEPVAMPDLRALRFETHLHRSGAVAQRSLASLAVRIETLIITAHSQAVRPPREVSLGLAVYLRALADALPSPVVARGASPRGSALFSAHCARCHSPDGYAGAVVAAEVVGTDPAIAHSPDRGTGGYRIPSLRGVGDRSALLHDGSAAGLGALLDPARIRSDYAGSRRGAGPIAGHGYGLDLGGDDRAALLGFLRAL